MKTLLFSILLCLVVYSVQGQNTQIIDSLAREAKKYVNEKDYEKAKDYYEKARQKALELGNEAQIEKLEQYLQQLPNISYLDLAQFFISHKKYLVIRSILLIISVLLTIILTLLQIFFLIRKNLTKNQTKDLHPFFEYKDVKDYTRYFIPTKYQTSPPSDKEEMRFVDAPKAKLIPYFLNKGFRKNKDQSRFYLVMADSGMGKTALMINLYFRYLQRFTFFQKKFQIKLIPLGSPFANEEIDKLKEKGDLDNTIILLDALDEDNEALDDYKKRIDTLINKIGRCRELVLTCRTQFFPNEKEEPFELKIPKAGINKGFHKFEKMYLSPFDDRDIRRLGLSLERQK